MKKTKCALCETYDNSTILHSKNLPLNGISSAEYAPRRKRDYIHYQIVKCNNCNLVRSDPIVDSTLIDNLGKQLLKESIRIQQIRDIFGIRAVDEIRSELNIS